MDYVKISFEHNGKKVFYKDNEVISDTSFIDFSDFSEAIRLRVVSDSLKEKEWTIILYDIPVLMINTPDSLPITSKVDRTDGCVMTILDDDGVLTELGTAGIKGRGNTTWSLPKKPYNIKMDKKHKVLGMKKSKHWQLLANCHYDRIQLHNATAFEMARLTDYPWVQEGRFVELIFNGKHQGLYYICEKIRVEEGRIDITELSPTDLNGETLTGGYMLESLISTKFQLENSFSTDYLVNCQF